MEALTKEDKPLWVANKVIELINRGFSKSDAQHRAEEDWNDLMDQLEADSEDDGR